MAATREKTRRETYSIAERRRKTWEDVSNESVTLPPQKKTPQKSQETMLNQLVPNMAKWHMNEANTMSQP